MTRIMRAALAAVLLAQGSATAAAQDIKMQAVGDWMVGRDPDRFGASDILVAMRVGRSGGALGIRCGGKDVTIVIGYLSPQPQFSKGDVFSVKFRADRKAIIETSAVALNDTMIAVLVEKQLVRDMIGAAEVAFRFRQRAGLGEFDEIYTTAGSARAIPFVVKSCRLP